ncbi:hypothetical protein [Alkalihalobacillus sp. BA299]|uniref:hypothetical protein n=1 Tax=Alkalihalobacillus sp. BA299 TaxID=2815938 RepID=UPI001ADC7CED|nr:hypothetical protein [Alkalihalobacillus sp. BA299]
MKINLLVDHVTRELNIYSYMAHLAELSFEGRQCNIKIEHQDFSVRENRYDFFERTIDNVDVTFTPSYNVSRTPSILSRATRTKSHLVVNHSEQIFSNEFYREKLNTAKYKAYNRHISAHLVWGRDFAEKLVAHSKVKPENIFITGNPKLDLVKRLQSDKSYIDNSNRTKVLIVSDFRLGDLNDQDWNDFQKKYKVNFKYQAHKLYQTARQNCVNWTKKAAMNFPDIDFLVRKHPGEPSEPYQELNPISNIYITGENEFSKDLLSSSVVFSFTSTSVFEVILSKKPYFNLDLIKRPLEMEQVHYKLFNWISEKEFNTILKSLCEDKQFKNKKIDYENLSNIMYKPYGNSLLRSAIALIEIAENAQVNKLRYNFFDKIKGDLYCVIPFIKNSLIKMGYFTKEKLKLDNPVSNFAANRWDEYKNSDEFISEKKLIESKEWIKNLLSEEEIQVIKAGNYSLRQEQEGIYIDLPEEVDEMYRTKAQKV